VKDVRWEELYSQAMLELDRASLRRRIEAARSAIKDAMRELASTGNASAEESMWAMTDALRNLQTLQWVEFSASSPARNLWPAPAEG
jgi:hypothetical protein